MDLADEEGIDALTMRELGRRLGVEAASLYNHVAGKDDLLDGMADLATAEIDVPREGVSWKEAMRRRAVSARETFARHRWAAALIDSRDRSGPSRLSYVDRVLGVLIQAGFSPTAAANALLVLDSYLYGFERQRPDGLDAGCGGRYRGGSGGPGCYPWRRIPVRGERREGIRREPVRPRGRIRVRPRPDS